MPLYRHRKIVSATRCESFFDALTELLHHIGRTGKIQVRHVNRANPVQRLKEREIHLYSVVREMINNSPKHSSGSVIFIDINKRKDDLFLRMRDGGTGFDHQQIMSDSTAFGLQNIFDRARLLEGAVKLETAHGKGAIYTIQIPIKNRHESSYKTHHSR